MSNPFSESPYNDDDALALLDDPLIRRPAPVVYRRQLGLAFFYCHPECRYLAKPYEQLPLTAVALGTVCSGCYGLLHDAPVVDDPACERSCPEGGL